MITLEIRAAEGGQDTKLLIDVLADCYRKRATKCG